MNINVTVSFGSTNTFEATVPQGTTVGQLLARPDVKSELGFGDSVKPSIDNVDQPLTTTLRNGDVVVLTTVANTKA